MSPSFDTVAALFESDVKRMVERHEARTSGHDRCDVEEQRGTVAFFRRSTLLWRAETELLASLVHGSIKAATGGLLRWTWGDKAPSGTRRIDTALYVTMSSSGIDAFSARPFLLPTLHFYLPFFGRIIVSAGSGLGALLKVTKPPLPTVAL